MFITNRALSTSMWKNTHGSKPPHTHQLLCDKLQYWQTKGQGTAEELRSVALRYVLPCLEGCKTDFLLRDYRGLRAKVLILCLPRPGRQTDGGIAYYRRSSQVEITLTLIILFLSLYIYIYIHTIVKIPRTASPSLKRSEEEKGVAFSANAPNMP